MAPDLVPGERFAISFGVFVMKLFAVLMLVWPLIGFSQDVGSLTATPTSIPYLRVDGRFQVELEMRNVSTGIITARAIPRGTASLGEISLVLTGFAGDCSVPLPAGVLPLPSILLDIVFDSAPQNALLSCTLFYSVLSAPSVSSQTLTYTLVDLNSSQVFDSEVQTVTLGFFVPAVPTLSSVGLVALILLVLAAW